MIRRLNSLYALLPLSILLSACTTDSDESVEPVTDPTPGFVAVFKPDLALMPFPTDLWRNGSTDGTLNIYAGNSQFDSDPLIGHVTQMNLLDGFGLNSPVLADFNEPVEETTVLLGATVFVFNITNPAAPVPVMTFDAGTADFQGGRSVVELDPTEPLDPLNTYAVYLTTNIHSEDGDAATADTSFQAMIDAYNGNGAGDLETGSSEQAIYVAMVESLLTLADGAGIGADNVVAAWTFTTQSKGATLGAVQAAAGDQVNGFVPLLRDPNDPSQGIRTAGELMMPDSDQNKDGTPDIGTNADVYAGIIEMPYYSDPANPLTGYWKADPLALNCIGAIGTGAVEEASESTTVFCPAPAVQATIAVPVLITVPTSDTTNPDYAACSGNVAGVTVFQHGITQNRTNILPVAGALAEACQATIAIDLPLHGITDISSGLFASSTNPVYAALKDLEAVEPGISEAVDALTEQTFNLDVDGEEGIDPSGEYFINLESPITARDALRQGVANLMNLVATIPNIDYNVALNPALFGADFATQPIHLVGHSLGGITGATFLGTDTTIDAAVLVSPGGDITELLLNSANIYPEVAAGLAENGLTAEMRLFGEFFRNAQTIIDSADPVNYAATANANHDILMMEVIGGAGVLPDQVVPNTATDDLAEAMGLPQVTATTVGTNVDGFVKFIAGDHGSLLSPAASQAATVEMQTQMSNYVGSNGNAIVITDDTVIAK